jgi:hypothetical protein
LSSGLHTNSLPRTADGVILGAVDPETFPERVAEESLEEVIERASCWARFPALFRPQRFAEGQPIKAEYEYVDD